MSLSLKRVELNNIRSHSSVIFEPESEGITALSGPTGAGKSSIIDSVAWVLYGTKPSGVSKNISIMKWGTDLSKQKCYANVIMEIDGVNVKVERRIVSKAGAVECEVWEEKDGIWSQVAGPAVTHAEPYIRRRMGMDEAGFLAAILVQQKQVDQLIDAKPNERGVVIEKLTGISSITAAMKEARENLNTVKREVKRITVDDTAMDDLTAEKDTLTKELDNFKNVMEKTQKESVSVRKELDNAAELLSTVEKIDESIAERRDTMARLEATIDSVESQFKEAVVAKDDAQKLIPDGQGMNVDEVRQEMNELKSRINRDQAQVGSQSSAIESEKKKLEELENLVEASGMSTVEEASRKLDEIVSKRQVAMTKRDQMFQVMADLRSSVKKVENAVEVLTSENGHCPTCVQSVPNISDVVAGLESQASSDREKLEKLSEQQPKVDAAIQEMDRAVSLFTKVVEAFGSIDTVKSGIDSRMEVLSQLRGQVKGYESELSALEKVYEKSRTFADRQKEYENRRDRAVRLSDQLDSLKRELSDLQKSTDEKRPTRKGLPKLREELEACRQKYDELVVRYRDAKEGHAVTGEKLVNVTDRITAAETEAKHFEEVKKELEALSHSVSVLEEFRENRIATAIPILEQYASDFLSRFTEGSYTRLKLDKKFAATVTLADGTETPVGLLSGGEVSAAALALRLAISMLLNNGSSQSLILLDEVLVSQDNNRSEQILSTVKDICRGQVIIISHMGNTSEVADKIVQL